MISSNSREGMKKKSHYKSFENSNLTTYPSLSQINTYSSLSFANNPIMTLKNFPTLSSLKELCFDNTLIKSFEGANPQPLLASVSFINTPIAQYRELATMCIVVFGDSIHEVNREILEYDVCQKAKKLRTRLKPLLTTGWLIVSIDPLKIMHYESNEQLLLWDNNRNPDQAIEMLPDIVELPNFVLPAKNLNDSFSNSTGAFEDSYHSGHSSASLGINGIKTASRVLQNPDSHESPVQKDGNKFSGYKSRTIKKNNMKPVARSILEFGTITIDTCDDNHSQCSSASRKMSKRNNNLLELKKPFTSPNAKRKHVQKEELFPRVLSSRTVNAFLEQRRRGVDVEELRRRGRILFYEDESAEYSTLQEMEEFVEKYVKEKIRELSSKYPVI